VFSSLLTGLHWFVFECILGFNQKMMIPQWVVYLRMHIHGYEDKLTKNVTGVIFFSSYDH